MNNTLIPNAITVQVTVNVPVAIAWQAWTTPADIARWNLPADDWNNSRIENDVKTGGHFFFRIEKQDQSMGFDHSGTYDEVVPHQMIAYTTTEGRKSLIRFNETQCKTIVTETFEPEDSTPRDLQHDFCKSVLENFKRVAEGK